MRELTELWPTTLTGIMFSLMILAIIISRLARTLQQYFSAIILTLAALATAMTAVIVHGIRGLTTPYKGMQSFYGLWAYCAIVIVFITMYKTLFVRRSKSSFNS